MTAHKLLLLLALFTFSLTWWVNVKVFYLLLYSIALRKHFHFHPSSMLYILNSVLHYANNQRGEKYIMVNVCYSWCYFCMHYLCYFHHLYRLDVPSHLY